MGHQVAEGSTVADDQRRGCDVFMWASCQSELPGHELNYLEWFSGGSICYLEIRTSFKHCNIIVADYLATQGAKASATMILTMSEMPTFSFQNA